jgi:hypothetical protein
MLLVAGSAVVLLLVVSASGQAAAAPSAAGPSISWSPTAGPPPPTFDFGSQTGVVTQAFKLTNSGGTATSALKITVSPSPPFAITVDGCTGTSLGPKKSCSVTVSFSPTVGVSATGTLAAASNKPTASASLTLKGSGAVPAPIISSPTDGFSTTSTTVTTAGTALPGASVSVFDHGAPVTSTTSAADGSWSVTLTLFIGSHSLTAKQTVNGQTSAASSAVGVAVVPPAPVITAPRDGLSTTSTSITVSGISLPNASVQVFDGGTPVAMFTADGSGNWSGPVTFAIGSHSLTATETVNGQTSAASNTVNMTITS